MGSPESDREGSTSLLCDKPENRQSGRSPLPEASPKVGRSPSFKLEEHSSVESKPGGSGGQLGGGGTGLGGLRDLGEQLVAEQEEEEVEEALIKPNGEDGRSSSIASTTSMVTSCQTLCASSVTDLVDTENTPFIDRLVSSSSQGTLVAENDCELLDAEDYIDNDLDFEL